LDRSSRFPNESLPSAGVFATPIVRGGAVALVFMTMFYWLWRIRGREFQARLLRRSERRVR
jgi:hypothetical protein